MRAKKEFFALLNALILLKQSEYEKRGIEMQKLLLILLLSVVVIACDEMQKGAINVVSEPIATEPTPVAEPEYLEITFENALDLAPGIYRVRPNSYNSGTDDFNDDVVTGLNWGSVNLFGEEIEGLPPDTPKVLVIIELNPQPYGKMINGKLAIEFERLADGTVKVDELLVEIGEKLREGTDQGGERGNKYDYNYVVYQGVALRNLTNPDRAFEYE